jgi:hypothetical protein
MRERNVVFSFQAWIFINSQKLGGVRHKNISLEKLLRTIR